MTAAGATNIRVTLRWVIGAILVLSSYWNIWTFTKRMSDLPPQNSDIIVAQGYRYAPVRAMLIHHGYQTGNVTFITNRTLQSQPNTESDNQRWAEAHFVMLPWILLSDSSAVSGVVMKADGPFVIGDFWDGVPAQLPADLVKLYESSDGLMLFERRLSP